MWEGGVKGGCLESMGFNQSMHQSTSHQVDKSAESSRVSVIVGHAAQPLDRVDRSSHYTRGWLTYEVEAVPLDRGRLTAASAGAHVACFRSGSQSIDVPPV